MTIVGPVAKSKSIDMKGRNWNIFYGLPKNKDFYIGGIINEVEHLFLEVLHEGFEFLHLNKAVTIQTKRSLRVLDASNFQ